MTNATARKRAASESAMWRQGRGWVVSVWDDERRTHYVSGAMPHGKAREVLAEWRARRAAILRDATGR